MSTVTWVKNAEDFYEISSPQHLIQLMHQGAHYTDDGEAPGTSTQYRSAKYVQTVDIDLANFHQDIIPMGQDYRDGFVGTYDGQTFAISNWSYDNSDNSTSNVGLFGNCRNATLMNLRLTGVWTAGGFSKYCGFLCAEVVDVFRDGSHILNCEGNFDEGTTIGTGTGSACGVLIGLFLESTIYGLTLAGTVDISNCTTVLGGVIGQTAGTSNLDSSILNVRNIATFPGGLKSTKKCGGVIGYFTGTPGVSNILNAMEGDIEGSRAGGVVGSIILSKAMNGPLDNLINSMSGNISSGGGGVVGFCSFSGSCTALSLTRMINYMNGSILGSSGGAIIGYCSTSLSEFSFELSNSIVAMNGTVHDAVTGTLSGSAFSTAVVEAVVNTDFGMTFTSNAYTPAISVGEGFVVLPMFPDLPYTELSGADDQGNVYEWDFVFSNVRGNTTKYLAYTHANIHGSKMSKPFVADFGGEVTGKHLTYANADTGELFKYGSIPVISTSATTVLEYEVAPSWVVDADGNYEVSSVAHVLQVMHKGGLYVDAGNAPTSYWGADTKFVQTRDIDLLYHHQHIVPIGNDTDVFMADYDGGNFEIRHWSYGNTDNSVEHTGLFGYAVGSILQNIRLTGVWMVGGFGDTSGFMCGRLHESELYNCMGDFDVGTTLAGGPASASCSGSLIGQCADSTVHGLTLSGTIDLAQSPTVRGCVIGRLYGSSAGSTLSYVRNVATFPGGNTSDSYSGGVIGWYGGGVQIESVINAMHGDLEGGAATGGIFGGISSSSDVDSGPIESLVNAMTGNITGGNSGGISGLVQPLSDQKTFQFSKLMNYATGNISGGGGIFGKFDCALTGDDLLYELNDSIVAMNGSVDHAVIASVTNVAMNTVSVVVNTDFGLTFVTNDYAPATTVGEEFVVDPLFPDLPRIEFSSTDAKGNPYDWDFVYANVGGKADYSDYTHAILHKGQVSAPFLADFGPLSVRHLAYANLGTGELFAYGDLEALSTNAPTFVDRPLPLTWVMDANGNYEVSSVRHLVQIMHNGGRYPDEGDAPPSGQYVAATTTFIQTADIDLSKHHQYIVPIFGFKGIYDGGMYSISNWEGGSTTEMLAGLFSTCIDATLQNIRLTGIWKLNGFLSSSGFLCASAASTKIFNCEGDFDQGTSIAKGSISSWSAGLGGLLGLCSSCEIHGLTLRGTVDFTGTATGPRGGVIGIVTGDEDHSVSHVRNLATILNGIHSADQPAGGIIGCWISGIGSIDNVLNAMHGDISSTMGGGGIFGWIQNSRTTNNPFKHSNIVNAMTGNILGGYRSGGIVGRITLSSSGQTSLILTGMMNYMNGAIEDGGGVVGDFACTVTGTAFSYEIKNSIVAMNGRAKKAVVSYEGQKPFNTVDVVINTDFGMTFTTNDSIASTSVGEGFLEFPMFPELPYVDLTGTDEKGNVYDWDFVYANVGGKEKYSAYTHASIHTGNMSAPFFTDFGEVSGRHLALANVQTGELFTDGAITPVTTDATTVLEYSLSTIETKVSPIAVTTTVIPVAGAVDLKLTYQAPGGVEKTAFTGFLGGVKSIDSLDSETQYTLRLYADMGTGAGYEFREASIASTPANTAENYRAEDFVEDGEIRLDRLSAAAKARISSVINELFNTGDKTRVSVPSRGKRYASAMFVNIGGTHDIKDVEALLVPFDVDAGSAQAVNLRLSNDSIAAVLFDESANTVSVESSVYTPGDYFIIDGLKCTVIEAI